MARKNRALLPVLVPLVLGIATALAFLFHYLGKNRAVVTIHNRTGSDLLGSQLRITSLPKEQEVGEIRNNDSAKVLFEGFGDGHYVFTGQFRDGKTMEDSGGAVASRTSYQDAILLQLRNDTPVAEISQNALE